ncbi:dihydrofolate reductase [Rhodotorula toruloides]|uniref:Dihydrofolate reductase n=1 Tax=Rhodotorula toruloides TaxID=5286 RepID=A0A511KDV3_RHOTO|nr:dihydrofolate reductase [Rhodotorula toruloides]
MSTRVRVLALPGHGQSASVLQAKLKRHKEIWGNDFEVVTMDPPYPLVNGSVSDDWAFQATNTDAISPTSFCWWDWSSHWRFKPGEFEGAVRHFRRFYENNGPFDVCFGFSQGAAMAVLVLALFERPNLHPVWLAGSPRPAFGPGDPDYVAWYKSHRPTTPTLHIIGKNDVVADPAHSLDTVARFANTTVVWHDGGHHIPRKPYFSHLIKDYILSSCDAHDWIDMPTRDGWGSPTESVASSTGGDNPLTGSLDDTMTSSRL